MKKTITFLFLAVIVCVSCKKESLSLTNDNGTSIRSIEEAADWARKSISLIEENNTKSGISARDIESWSAVTSINTTKSGTVVDTLLYVFNFADNAGFSIIAANTSLKPIIAVTESGHYDAGCPTGNEGFDFYINGLTNRIANLANSPELYSWYDYVTNGESIDKNVGVRWGQQDIYGQYCPDHISGCSATAMAQIMAYHCYPSSFVTTVNMGSDFISGQTIPLEWSGLKKHKVTHTLSQDCVPYHKYIGTLFREIGKQINTTYHQNSSGSTAANVPNGFEYFGYTASAATNFSIVAAKKSIKNDGPVFICGFSATKGGHAWIADGYKDYQYYRCKYERATPDSEPVITEQQLIKEEHVLHINWGYNGESNGYFSFGVFDMDDAESYDYYHIGPSENYGDSVMMIAVRR